MQLFIVILYPKYAYKLKDGRTQSGYTLIHMTLGRFLYKWNKVSEKKNRQIFQCVSEFKFRNATVQKRESITLLSNIQVSFESS